MRRFFAILIAVLVVFALSMTAFASEARFSPEEVEFPFLVTLRDADGNELTGEFEYTGDRTGTIQSGHVIWLSDGETVDIVGLPAGTEYVVSELPTKGYDLDSVSGNEGVIVENGVAVSSFVNDENPCVELPASGGNIGSWLLLGFGVFACFCVGFVIYVRYVCDT